MGEAFDPKGLGGAAPKVEFGDLEEDVAILTIAGFEKGEIDDETRESGKRPVAFLTFEELGDKRLYLGVRQGEALVHHYGADPDQFVGKQVPVERAKRRFGNKTFEKVIVVEDPDAWSDYMDLPAKKQLKKVASIKGAKGAKKARGRS